ncbi:putative RNA recognition motif domain, nucleotide-binding alpha-beta plait domain superfamily [Helianthus annuus]|uniref:Putative RNA-binding (RRM/RBD/RNP motifs) family protein n=1 Tax=Helianthus annuus TaxID=4232 RepID=A0A251SQL0_HELAN|nr:RNA-binding protein 34 [Helianthus annuus]KAF5772564.1 putative RNA recognition motif domain, nucleotide-binding alpha-beta plait domain superfamily [Helianthus annuus]KAJ0848390.1 putative RNA recognition motif domain, nucleotide-binding alpha-beta plait domain superfamily [Helianthus annuus]
MGKKPKESKPETPNSPPSNSIFKTLFGITNIQEPNDPSSVSIFSDSNPFRTKPTNESQKLQQILQLDIDSPQKNHTQIPNSPNKLLSKRKRKDKQKIDQDDSDIESEVKKSKLENAVVSERLKRLVIDEEDDNKRKKKKRKRADVEAEYEERKYGGVDLELVKDEGVKGKIGGKRKEVDKEELVAKEGFDDEEKLLRTVFVGNLPLKVKKKALLKEFDRFGEIESVRIRSVPILDDKTPRKGAIIKKQINDAVDRVNAYIVFKTEDSAQASLSHNMAVVGGNHIHVDRACPPRKKFKGENAPLYDTKRTVFIGNLPFDVKDEELYQLFTGFSNLKDCIEAIRVVRDPGTSMGKGIAYVLFTTRDAANTVVRKHKLKIRDRELRLSHATKTNSNSTPSKRKEPSTPDNYGSSKKAAASGSTSYQGIRATKSGGQKKFATRVAKPGRSESGSEKTVKRKVRSEKRPAVAARKAAANAARTGGDGGSGGVKRKPENRTPQSSSRNKKPRRFR